MMWRFCCLYYAGRVFCFHDILEVFLSGAGFVQAFLACGYGQCAVFFQIQEVVAAFFVPVIAFVALVPFMSFFFVLPWAVFCNILICFYNKRMAVLFFLLFLLFIRLFISVLCIVIKNIL